MKLKECENVKKRNKGKKLCAVCEKKTYDEAVEYCEGKGRVLASLHSNRAFNKIDESSCPKDVWNVGLKLNGSEGRWEDGTKFNKSLHGELFGYDYIGSGCVYLHASDKKLYLHDEAIHTYKFFCRNIETLTTTRPQSTSSTRTSTTKRQATTSTTSTAVEAGIRTTWKSSTEMTTIAADSNASSLTPLTIVVPAVGFLLLLIFILLFLWKRRKKNKSRQRSKNERSKTEMKSNPVYGGQEEGAGAEMKSNPVYGGLGEGAEMKSNPVYGGLEEGAGAEMKPNPVYGGLEDGADADMKSNPVYGGVEEGAGAEMKSNPVYGGLEVENEGLVACVDSNRMNNTDGQYSTIPAHSSKNQPDVAESSIYQEIDTSRNDVIITEAQVNDVSETSVYAQVDKSNQNKVVEKEVGKYEEAQVNDVTYAVVKKKKKQ